MTYTDDSGDIDVYALIENTWPNDGPYDRDRDRVTAAATVVEWP
jgi:hypothetical protein